MNRYDNVTYYKTNYNSAMDKKLFGYIGFVKMSTIYTYMSIYRVQFIVFLFISQLGCRSDKIEPEKAPSISFFYWKSSFKLEASSKIWLDSIPVKKLYIRFFDIDVDLDRGPVPIAPLMGLTDSLAYSLTPVLFVTNETFLKVREEGELVRLGDKLVTKLLQMSQQQNVKEWLIDCDWSPKTREIYFKFLRILNVKAQKYNIRLMATIRLDQYKNYKMTGVPPVKSGLLMAYNMGDVDDWDTENSILNEKDADLYLRNPSKYPIPLSLGLPFYQWGVVFRDFRFIRLINGLDESDLLDKSRFKSIGKYRYVTVRSTYLNGLYLYKGDHIRIEKIEALSILKMKKRLKDWRKVNINEEIVFFHLDESIINRENGSFFRRFGQKVSAGD